MSAPPSGWLNSRSQPTFLTELERRVTHSAAKRELLALLLVRLGNVTELNAAFGYRVADRMLAAFAERLECAFARRSAVLRIGTSRFAVLLPGVKSESHALLAASKVCRIAEVPVEVEGYKADIDVVQGLAMFPEHAVSGNSLLRCAETALAVSERSRSPVRLFSATESRDLEEFGRIEAALVRALSSGGIEAHFQPQVDLETGRWIGAEALLRCVDTDGRVISAESLVRVAERTKRSTEITTAVLNTALRHAVEWPLGDRSLSVNVSTKSLKDPDLLPLLTSTLNIWAWPPDALTIEITESAFMDDPDSSFAALRELRALGVRVAIDDFGTGYSSLAYFTNIPANELKVDKSFVFRMLQREDDRRIVQAVVGLAHAFELQVVAEGVEDAETVNLLKEMGCEVGQGFYFGKPMSPAAFLDWIERAGSRGAV